MSPARPKSLCRRCKKLIDKPGFCDDCKSKEQRFWDKRRGSAAKRGYTVKWYALSSQFRSRPENQFCALQLPGCTGFTEVTDHIKPCLPDDPLFWDENNWQPACIHCNSVKGRREMKGEG